nr:MAG TPA: hypothetical protein [Caudoviricetes sp.]
MGSELLISDKSLPGNIRHLSSCGLHLMEKRPVFNDAIQCMTTLDDDLRLIRIGHIGAQMTCYDL